MSYWEEGGQVQVFNVSRNVLQEGRWNCVVHFSDYGMLSREFDLT